MRNSTMLFCMGNASPSWDHYKSFLLVLRTGSLSAAARSLGVRQSTIGRQIEALEAELQIPLFTRSQKGLRPTDTALRLKPHLETLASTSEALVRDAHTDDSKIGGIVRLTTSGTVGNDILPQVLKELQANLPRIQFEISISDDIQDLLLREADIAIRSGPMKQKAIIAKKVGDLEMGLYGSKDYFKGKTIPKTDEELSNHPLIGLYPNSDRARSATKIASYLAKSDFAYATNDVNLHSRLVDAGCGLGLCRVNKKNNDRIRVLPEIHGAHFPMWVAMHENLKKNKKFRAVFNELASILKKYLD